MVGEGTLLTTGEMDEWRTQYERVDSPSPYHSPAYLELLAGNFEHDEAAAEDLVWVLEGWIGDDDQRYETADEVDSTTREHIEDLGYL